MEQNQLASKILYLPLFLPERIQIWLTYKGLKPASIISLSKENGSFTEKHKKRVMKWLKDAGLSYLFDPEPSTHKKLIISLDKTIVEEIAKMEIPLSDDNQYRLGTLLGYPSKAAHAYAFSASSLYRDDSMPISIKKDPAYLYVDYRMRIGHENEDIQIARRWMTTIRHDLPKLARWYENCVSDTSPHTIKTTKNPD